MFSCHYLIPRWYRSDMGKRGDRHTAKPWKQIELGSDCFDLFIHLLRALGASGTCVSTVHALALGR